MKQIIGAPLHLAAIGFWQPTEGENAAPEANLLGARARGRASQLTLMFAEVLGQALAGSGINSEEVALIFGSALGEMERLIQLLTTLHGPTHDISPLRFQTSVHNASAGQISIALKNPNFSNSLAAGRNTVAMGFVEAAVWMHTRQTPLVLVLGDEAPPPELHVGSTYAPLAAAFAFLPEAIPAQPSATFQLVATPSASHNPEWADTPAIIGNPCRLLEPLVSWLRAGTMDRFELSSGGPTQYGIERR